MESGWPRTGILAVAKTSCQSLNSSAGAPEADPGFAGGLLELREAVRFGVLFLALTATVITVVVVMFETLAWLVGG